MQFSPAFVWSFSVGAFSVLALCLCRLSACAIRFCSGVMRFAFVREYSGVGAMSFAFVLPKSFGCDVRFAFARGASARFKGFGRISSRCNRNKPTPA
jgi:hypothetical protein